MARIRTIKPEFWVSPQVVECSTNARLLFLGLLNFSDDGGVHPANAKQAKMEIFPGDDFAVEQVTGWIDELIAVGLLGMFRVPDDVEGDAQVYAGERFWYVTGWHHQRIDKPSPKYPPPSRFVDHSSTIRRTFDEGSRRSLRESKGRESKGRDPNPSLSASPTADDRKPSIGEPGLSQRSPDAPPKHSAPEYPTDFEAFWSVVPPRKRDKKQEAFRKYKHAVELLRARPSIQDAHVFLRDRATAYYASPLGQTQYASGPAPWLHQGGYDADESSWQRFNDRQRTFPLGPGQRHTGIPPKKTGTL